MTAWSCPGPERMYKDLAAVTVAHWVGVMVGSLISALAPAPAGGLAVLVGAGSEFAFCVGICKHDVRIIIIRM
jgi:hypothetical protein